MESLVEVSEMKDGVVWLTIRKSSETLAYPDGQVTTFLAVSEKELERVYAELGYYLFERGRV